MKKIAEYHRPRQIDEALRLLARPGVATVPIGGGSDWVAAAQPDVQAVVDLQDLDLSYIRSEGAALHAGATTTLQALIDSPDAGPAWHGELAAVVAGTATRNLREVGTLAGALVSAAHNNPLAVTLLALDAALTLLGWRAGSRPDTEVVNVSLDEFFSRRESLLPGRLITEVTIPLPGPGETLAFEKVSRTPADLPIVCAAVWARGAGPTAADVRIGLGGVGARPLRARHVEQALAGQPLEAGRIDQAVASAAEIDPPSDFLGSRAYRRAMAAVLIHRAFARR